MDKKRIIVIDDDEVLCQGTAFILEDEGYSVVSTSDPVQALLMVQKEAFDIALIDYKMPHLTGSEVLKKLKEKNPVTKAFIVSGRPFIEKTLHDDNASHLVEGIIKKPFSEQTLLDAVTVALSGNGKGDG